jgi:hypothetical protein
MQSATICLCRSRAVQRRPPLAARRASRINAEHARYNVQAQRETARCLSVPPSIALKRRESLDREALMIKPMEAWGTERALSGINPIPPAWD